MQNNAKKYLYDRKSLSTIEQYKVICCLFRDAIPPNIQSVFDVEHDDLFGHDHTHHIKPKSIYPQLANNEDNLVNVPDIVHWALHELLARYAKESGDEEFKNIVHSDVASFIIKKRGIKYNFCDSMLDEILQLCFDAAVICRKNGLLLTRDGSIDFDSCFFKPNYDFRFAFSKIHKDGKADVTRFRYFDIMSLTRTYCFAIWDGSLSIDLLSDQIKWPQYRTLEKLNHQSLSKEMKSRILQLEPISIQLPQRVTETMQHVMSIEVREELSNILNRYAKPNVLDFTAEQVEEIICFSK